MKRIYSAIFGALLIISLSCEENFSPKQEFEEQYIVSCVIGIGSESSSFSPSLYLTKSYDVDGLNPENGKTDPTVSGALGIISYKYGNSYSLYENSTIVYHPTIPDSVIYVHYNRYNNPYIIYSGGNIPVKYQTLQLNITLPNGKKLSSETELPRGIFLEYSYNFPHGITSKIDQWKYGNSWDITWTTEENQIYYSELKLYYYIENGSTKTYKSVEVPLQFVKNGNITEAVYPKFNNPGKLEYKYDALTTVLQNISKDVTDKNSIVIQNLKINITELDKELSAYYSSLNGFMDNYSVRLDEQVYSNINGGMGIFGSYRTTSVTHLVDKTFATSFGYRTNY